ncbi:MAG: o-succinylbenzoate--CoA ligase [bacterium]
MREVPGRFFLWEGRDALEGAPALAGPDCLLTYGEVCRRMLGIADALRTAGIGRGDRIAVLGPNSVECVLLLIALWRLGAVAVPVSTRWPPGLVDMALEGIGCRTLVLSRDHAGEYGKAYRVFLLDEVVAPCRLDQGTPEALSHPVDCDQDATIIYTSGSSGTPKAVLHTLGNHCHSALGSNALIPFAPGDRWLLSLPLYHIAGIAILFRAALGGGAVAVPGTTAPIDECIRQEGVTHCSLVSTQLYRLLQKRETREALSRMKAILLGGGAFPDRLIEKALEYGLPIHLSYGSTEMASQITTAGCGGHGSALQCSGAPLPFREVKIAPDGEILVRGQTLFKGYVQGAAVTRGCDREGWFHTGDTGLLDEKGDLTVTGRRDRMFISGGENIQPEEIERHLCRLPGVLQAVVVPVRDEEFGERPVAFVEMGEGASFEPRVLARRLEPHLPRFKIPDQFLPWPDAVSLCGEKPNRMLLRKLAEESLSPG